MTIMTMIMQNNTKSNCRLRNLISVSHFGARSVCGPTPPLLLLGETAVAVSFMIMMSTKYLALRLIGTVINVRSREMEKNIYIYSYIKLVFFLVLIRLILHMEITV